MHCIYLQSTTHIQEVRHSLGLQNGVDSHPSSCRGVQQVLEDLQVRQEIHDYGHHLRNTQEERFSSEEVFFLA